MPTNQLSALNRKQCVNNAASTPYDLVIIGGGITGSGIALDAASRGLNCLVLDMQDFAAGTSSRSTKLIHGGLRYLKQLEVALVREVGLERATIHKNAPHLVVPKKMILPIIKKGSLGKNSTSLGLYVYDWLAGVDADERRSMHSKADTLAQEPLLREDVLVGGGLYYEYQSDDARLVIEVLKTAATFGAMALNYAEVVDFTYNEEGNINGVKVMDLINDYGFNVAAKQVVNATGPWVDRVRSKDEIVKGKRLHLTKGVHLVVPYERLPIRQAVYFDTPNDKRMIFAIPRGNTTYIGTTDTTYYGNIERPQTSRDDVDYVLEAVNFMFPSVNLTIKDVNSSWAGLRPLIHQDGKSPSELSRKDEIFYSENGLISIAGGKLTGFRKMAERTVDIVMKELYKQESRAIRNCVTDTIKLSGGEFDHYKEVEKFVDKIHQEFTHTKLKRTQIDALVFKYGTNTPIVLQKFVHLNKKYRHKAELRLLTAELHYCVANEMVHTLSDFLIRRTGRLYFERPSLEDTYLYLIDELAALLKLSRQEKLRQVSEFEKEYMAAVNFKEEEVLT